MTSKASVVDIAYFVMFASFALPLHAVTLHQAQEEALVERAGHGVEAGEADSRSGMMPLHHLLAKHRASEPEIHARANAAYRRYTSKLAENGCNYKGGLLPCPNGKRCYYNGVAGVNISATVEYRGNIVKTILQPEEEMSGIPSLDQPPLVVFMGAATDDEPAMLTEVPDEYRRTANPVLLKMFFVEDTDDVTEECPADSERVERMGNETVSYSVENGTKFAISTSNNSMFLGMGFEYLREEDLGHTLAFEIPASTEIVWVSREEMVQVLLTQELPASTEARLEAQLRKAMGMDEGMDGALTQKHSRRRRRRRWCNGAGQMIGGAAAMGAGIALCIFTFIGCFTASPFLMFAGGKLVTGGACSCWSQGSSTACTLAR